VALLTLIRNAPHHQATKAPRGIGSEASATAGGERPSGGRCVVSREEEATLFFGALVALWCSYFFEVGPGHTGHRRGGCGSGLSALADC
jgi:hypothetical protein